MPRPRQAPRCKSRPHSTNDASMGSFLLLPLVLPLVLAAGCLLLLLRAAGGLLRIALRGVSAEGGALGGLGSLLAVGGLVVLGGVGALGLAVGGVGISRGASALAAPAPIEAEAGPLAPGANRSQEPVLTVTAPTPLEPALLEVALSRALGQPVVAIAREIEPTGAARLEFALLAGAPSKP